MGGRPGTFQLLGAGLQRVNHIKLMIFFPISAVLMSAVWLLSLTLWLIPEQTRWDYGLFSIYTSTFFELPILAVLIGTLGIFLHKKCTDSRLFKITMALSWGYVFFPILTSALLILAAFTGLTGY